MPMVQGLDAQEKGQKPSFSPDRFFSGGEVRLTLWGQPRRLQLMARCLLCRAGDVQEQRIDGGRALRDSRRIQQRRHT